MYRGNRANFEPILSVLQMLQQARLPRGVAEWTAVGEAISSLGPYLQSDSNPEALLSDLHLFTLSVEQWWASRRRTAGDGPSAPKRPSQPTLLQPNGKRAAHDGLIPNNQAFMLEGSGSLPLDGIVNGNLLSDTDVALAGLMPHQPAGQRQANGAQDADHDRLPRIISAGIRESPRDGSNGNGAAAGQAAQPAPPTNLAVLGKTMVILNVGGLAFSTTAATLTSVEGSYFQKLAMKASSGAANEFFIDRSGTLFHHVLDHLRGQRYGEPIKGLPEDVRELQLLQNEAAFYRLPQLERQAADAAAAAGGEVCDAIYIQTGFVEESGLDDAHMHLLLRLNAKVGGKILQQMMIIAWASCAW